MIEKTDMKIIILAGGLGTRLWPHSQSPKQFSITEGGHSLLQKTLLRFLKHCNPEDLVIVTQDHFLQEAITQAKEIEESLEKRVIAEPEKKNTAPATLFALKWMEKQGETPSTFLVSPSDHLISPESLFLEKIQEAQQLSLERHHILFGAFPTHPHPGYGYITCDPEKNISDVESFIEKPILSKAQSLLETGKCLWNTGIVLFHRETFFKDLKQHQPEMFEAYETDTFRAYPNLSLDHAFHEHFNHLKVIPLPLSWSDVGSWEGIYEAFEKDAHQNVKIGNIVDLQTKGCFILGDKRKIAAIDLEDLIIVDTKEALLIAKRGSTQKIPLAVEKLESVF
ncbi:MAG: Mannose-1-phosphate guanylyltransferase RfbM [Chlamydiae bacterium]|nr:Mannose-1-phosphate guanylyltransferase RfbM [Chlamydiota bacterium]